ncbi:hypothetical protein CDAR_298971 [Caerostris darwini]|uniref:Uncharacterized protein n=1 Tax=Caerostris darwini TaxID=1538125 RepID=A0AAV4PEL2_9ARAC|nr:hypothetical protein CDAR_298971 [Caerostris darwini]
MPLCPILSIIAPSFRCTLSGNMPERNCEQNLKRISAWWEGGFLLPSLEHFGDTKINLHEVLKDHGWLLKANASILPQLGIKREICASCKCLSVVR